MSLKEFESLELKKGMQMNVSYYERGNRKLLKRTTGHVEYRGDGKGYEHIFSTNNWANDFFDLWINEIDTITIFN